MTLRCDLAFHFFILLRDHSRWCRNIMPSAKHSSPSGHPSTPSSPKLWSLKRFEGCPALPPHPPSPFIHSPETHFCKDDWDILASTIIDNALGWTDFNCRPKAFAITLWRTLYRPHDRLPLVLNSATSAELDTMMHNDPRQWSTKELADRRMVFPRRTKFDRSVSLIYKLSR